MWFKSLANNNMKIAAIVLVVALVSCAPVIHTSITDTTMKPLAANTDVLVVDAKHLPPDSCRLIGTIKVDDNLFTADCSYDNIIEGAKAETRKAGGNVLKITEVLPPDVKNSSYRIKANILYLKGIKNVIDKLNAIQDSITKSKFPANPNYALLYIYRLEAQDGYIRGFNIHNKDSVICKINNNSKYAIKLYKSGKTIVWAQTETKDSVSIDVKFGEEYFLKCTLKMGVVIGRPDMELISKEQGRFEYESMK